jgi:hypothetical protein
MRTDYPEWNIRYSLKEITQQIIDQIQGANS